VTAIRGPTSRYDIQESPSPVIYPSHRRIKEHSESSKSGEWNIAQESVYEALDRDITRAMLHAELV
jgi:hypothetical protein